MTSSLDFSTQGFSSFERAVAEHMRLLLSAHSLGLSYDSSSKKFTVLKSSSFKKKDIEQFLIGKYEGWRPSVLNELDRHGNRLIKLMMICSDRSSKAHLTGCRELSFKPHGFVELSGGGGYYCYDSESGLIKVLHSPSKQ